MRRSRIMRVLTTKAQPRRTCDVAREGGYASAIRRWLQQFVRPRGNHLLKTIPKTVPRTKSTIKHQREIVLVRYRLQGQNGGNHRQRTGCAPSANNIQPSKRKQPSAAIAVAARSMMWRLSASADANKNGSMSAPATSATTNQSMIRIGLGCCVGSCMACEVA